MARYQPDKRNRVVEADVGAAPAQMPLQPSPEVSVDLPTEPCIASLCLQADKMPVPNGT
jgi:hypothetical protein